MSSEGGHAEASDVIESTREYYSTVLSTSADLKTSACTTAGKPPAHILQLLRGIPAEVLAKYYGCGNPVPLGINGATILDLGCGSGRDCYLAAAMVGDTGSVIGLDMTDEQLEVARTHAEKYCTETLGYPKPNMRFVKGYIEGIAAAGVAPASVDLVISNCVVNLSPDKPAVIQGAYDCLREGGELYFSDVYADRRVPESIRKHKVLWGECISGALYIEDFKRICRQVGFTDVRQLSISKIEITDPALHAVCGHINFYSITFRCFKLASLETLCEDYGQCATYLGTIPELPWKYSLDDHHVFETGRRMLVCGNSAAMVGQSWLRDHFRVDGDTSTHFGLFPGCGDPLPTAGADSSECGPGGCGPGGC